MDKPFRPNGPTKNIDVAATSATVLVGSPETIRIMNDGTATVWVEFGGSGVTAALATSMPFGAGVTEVIEFDVGLGQPVYVAAIAAGATGKIYFTPGVGI